MSRLKELLQNCERWIREGEIEQVHKSLAGIQAANSSKIARELRLPLANICRRVGNIALGLRLLGPLIHTDKQGWRTDATSPELAEYAVLLQRSGAIQEALWVLGQVDATLCPEAHLYKGFFLFGIWEYENAAISLEKFLKSSITSYQNLVGRVNLAAAFIALERRDEAEELIANLLPQAIEGKYSRLKNNCLELRAQLHFQRGRYNEALKDLHEAAGEITSLRSIDHFLVRKWTTIIDAISAKTVTPLLRFRSEAIVRGDWECVREMDRFALKIEFSQDRFDYLLFGTPFPPYREMIKIENGDKRPSIDIYKFGSGNQTVVDLIKGKIETQKGFAIDATPSIFRVLDALTKDFYRPLAIGGMFAELFPGEHFNIDSSIHRVHQSVYRARQWIEENELSLELNEKNGEYSLKTTGELSIMIPFERRLFETSLVRMNVLRQHFASGEFVPREARKVLGISSTSLKALISAALEVGELERSGAGRSTRYRFQKSA